MAPDETSATLAGIKERYAKCGGGYSSNPGDYIHSAEDVPRLLAAVEAALKVADEANELEVNGVRLDWWTISPAQIREAIRRALNGGNGNG